MLRRSRMSFAVTLFAALALFAGVVTQPIRPANASSSSPAFGHLGHAIALGDSVTNITTTEVEITPLRVTFFVSDPGAFANRWVEFTAVLRVQTSDAPTTVNAYLDVDDNNCIPCLPVRTAGTNTYLAASGGAGSETMVLHGFAYLRDSQFTARVYVKRSVGTGTVTVSQTAGTPMTLFISDQGKP